MAGMLGKYILHVELVVIGALLAVLGISLVCAAVTGNWHSWKDPEGYLGGYRWTWWVVGVAIILVEMFLPTVFSPLNPGADAVQ